MAQPDFFNGEAYDLLRHFAPIENFVSPVTWLGLVKKDPVSKRKHIKKMKNETL